VDPHAYVEQAAPRTGAVLWRRVVPASTVSRILPDGCLDLIWSSRAGLFVAGPDTIAQLSPAVAGERMVGLRLPPGVGPAVLGLPAHELTDRRVPLDAVWPAAVVRDLAERLAAAADLAAVERLAAAADPAASRWPATRAPDLPTARASDGPADAASARLGAAAWRAPADGFPTARLGVDAAALGVDGPGRLLDPGDLLDRAAAARLREVGGPDPVATPIARLLAAGATVADTAAEVGLSARQLHRRARELYGYGPKTLARILRLRRALALLDGGLPPGRAAADAGYADQPHLAREVRTLAGVPLGRLRAA